MNPRDLEREYRLDNVTLAGAQATRFLPVEAAPSGKFRNQTNLRFEYSDPARKGLLAICTVTCNGVAAPSGKAKEEKKAFAAKVIIEGLFKVSAERWEKKRFPTDDEAFLLAMQLYPHAASTLRELVVHMGYTGVVHDFALDVDNLGERQEIRNEDQPRPKARKRATKAVTTHEKV